MDSNTIKIGRKWYRICDTQTQNGVFMEGDVVVEASSFKYGKPSYIGKVVKIHPNQVLDIEVRWFKFEFEQDNWNDRNRRIALIRLVEC